MIRVFPLLAGASLMLSLSACDQANRDPFERIYTWQPTGANEENLRAMVANPNDLTVGQSARGSHAIIANAAVTRVLTDKVKPLPKVSTGGVGGGGGEAAAGGGGSTTGLGGSGGAAQ